MRALLLALSSLVPIPVFAYQRAGLDAAWLERAAAHATAQEYYLSPRGRELWTAPNRAQGLRMRLSAGVLEVFPRATDWRGEGADWTVRMETIGFGRVGDLRPVPAPQTQVDLDRAELMRGELVEWFVNDSRGIEQGWTIPHRPAGTEALAIGLRFEGADVRVESGGRSARLSGPGREELLQYAGLRAWDAAGRELEARLVEGDRETTLFVQVQDAGAVYPLTVDPVLSTPGWIGEADQADARYGWSVAPAGDVNGDGYSDILVGAIWFDDGENNEGRAFAYYGSAGGPPTTADWFVDGNLGFAEMGWSVSTAGDVNGDGFSDVVIGAANFSNGEVDEGAAFVYLGSASGLSTTPVWSDEGNETSAKFGSAVSTAGDVNGDGFSDIVIGAPLDDGTLVDEGRAAVYLGSASGPAATPAWNEAGGVASGQFGFAVATAGDVNGDGFDDLAVGADRYTNGQTEEGAAFVFHGSGGGLSTVADWSIESDQANAELGSSVRAAGDVNGDGFADLAVGLPGFSNGQASEGGARVYHGGAGGLSLVADFTYEGNAAGSRFGTSVSGAGDLNADGFSDLAVGGPNFGQGQLDEGGVAVFLGSDSGLELPAFFNQQSNQAGALLGFSVAGAGDTNGDGYGDLLMGAWGFSGGQVDEGRAFLFYGSSEEMPEEAFVLQANQVDANLGSAVAGAGDVNGDGFSDVLFGAPQFDDGEVDEGIAYLYLGGPDGIGGSPDWTGSGEQVGARFGAALASAGDVNGDGYDDVVVGASAYTDTLAGEGRAFVYLGSSTGLSASAAWTVDGDQMDAALGTSVAGAGDVDGDGYADVLVGAPLHDDVGSDDGRALLFLGSDSGLATTPAWETFGPAGSNYGASVAGAGDVDADGDSEVLIGAPRYTNGENGEGAAFLFLGASPAPSTTADWSAESDQVLADFGRALDGVGDMNGDGFGDIVVGARAFDGGLVNEGRVFGYFGSGAGPSLVADWFASGGQTGGFLGAAVAAAGDVDGDGYGDVLVGAPRRENGQLDEGQALLYFGAAGVPSALPGWIRDGNLPGTQYGFAVAGAGDVDGDGYADVVVGGPFLGIGQVGEGGGALFLGNDARGGLVEASRQRRSDGSAPIAAGGLSDDTDTFRVLVELPRGLAGVRWAAPGTPEARLEVEVKPLGVPFDGLGTQTSALAMSVAEGALPLAFEEVVVRAGSGAMPERWRARIVFDHPLVPTTPWFSLQGSDDGEGVLRFPSDGGPPRFYIDRQDFVQVP